MNIKRILSLFLVATTSFYPVYSVKKMLDNDNIVLDNPGTKTKKNINTIFNSVEFKEHNTNNDKLANGIYNGKKIKGDALQAYISNHMRADNVKKEARSIVSPYNDYYKIEKYKVEDIKNKLANGIYNGEKIEKEALQAYISNPMRANNVKNYFDNKIKKYSIETNLGIYYTNKVNLY